MLKTKLARYAGGILEAAWLAAVIGVPLFFNVYSSNVFEPGKVALLRSLALVSVAAWAIRLIDQGAFHGSWRKEGESWFRSIRRIPLILPVAALMGIYLISTVFSIDVRVSLFGSYERMQGTYTTFSYLVIFASIAGNLRRRAQVQRLVTAVILASIPVSLYGILQHYHLDPISWGGDASSRVTASMGNAIFLGGYLIMVFPLTIYRIAESFDSLLNNHGRLIADFWRSTAYVFILALQLLALFFTGSRGPWLGWIAGVFFTFVLLALVWRKRYIAFGLAALVLSGTAFLFLLNLPSGPLVALQSVPGFKRASQLLDIESSTGQVRVLIWKGVANLVAPHQPLVYPDGGQDALNPLRPLIGYGPESMYFAYSPFYTTELAHTESQDTWPDRAHNETWDALVRSGLLGLAVYLALFGSLFYYGLKWLGLIASDRERIWFWGLYLGGGAAGAAGFVLAMGAGFFGIGLPFGVLAGTLVYLVRFALFKGPEKGPTHSSQLQSLLLIALLAALISHFVEINFGIAVTVTRLYFWVEAGLLLASGYFLPEEGLEPLASGTGQSQGEPTLPEMNGKSPTTQGKNMSRPGDKQPETIDQPWLWEGLISSFMIALILVPLGYDFLTNRMSSGSTFSLLWSSMTRLPTLINSGVSYGILAMALMTLLLSAILLASEAANHHRSVSWSRLFVSISGLAILLGFIFWVWQSYQLTMIAPVPPDDLSGASITLDRTENLLVFFFLFNLALVFGLAFFLTGKWPNGSLRFNWVRAAVAPVLFGFVLYLAWVTNLEVVQADMASRLAGSYFDRQNYPLAAALYQRATSLAPAEAEYDLYLGKTYVEYARSAQAQQTREQLIGQARAALERAQRLNPLNPDHTSNLARLYNLWATFTNVPAIRADRGTTSSEYYAQATAMSPNNVELWDEWGEMELKVLNQPPEALSRYAHALALDPAFDWTHALLGDYYALEARSTDNPQDRQVMLEQAADHYQQAINLISPIDIDLWHSYSQELVDVYTRLGQPGSAISTYQRFLEQFPDYPDRWKIEEAIARFYLLMGDQEDAVNHLKIALAEAPEDQKPGLLVWLAQLGMK